MFVRNIELTVRVSSTHGIIFTITLQNDEDSLISDLGSGGKSGKEGKHTKSPSDIMEKRLD